MIRMSYFQSQMYNWLGFYSENWIDYEGTLKFNYNKLNQNYKIGELYFFLSQHRNFLVDKLEIWDTNLRSTFVWWIGLRMKGYYVRKLCIFFHIRMRNLSSWHVWSLTARAAGWYREPELMVMVWTWSIQLPNPAPSRKTCTGSVKSQVATLYLLLVNT